MTVTKVKICCIASLSEARLALAHGASALGFVAAMPSGPGVIDDDTIAKIIAALPDSTDSFLLTSRTQPGDVVAHVKHCRPSTVQLVDAVPQETYDALRQDSPHTTIVQVIHVEDESAICKARHTSDHVDAVLLDSGTPNASVKHLGGTGRTHDWAVSRAVVDAVDVPVYLAGGLNASNVASAVAQVKPFGVDLCSGVRTDKRLDEAKLTVFMSTVNNMRRSEL